MHTRTPHTRTDTMAATFIPALLALRDSGESLGSIGRRFGVSHPTVLRWLQGVKPSRQTLVMARYVLSDVTETAPGLPSISGQSAPDPRPVVIGPPAPAKARKPDAG